jgi:hypothetical protein
MDAKQCAGAAHPLSACSVPTTSCGAETDYEGDMQSASKLSDNHKNSKSYPSPKERKTRFLGPLVSP